MRFLFPITLIQSGQTNKQTNTQTHKQQSSFNNIDLHISFVVIYVSILLKEHYLCVSAADRYEPVVVESRDRYGPNSTTRRSLAFVTNRIFLSQIFLF